MSLTLVASPETLVPATPVDLRAVVDRRLRALHVAVLSSTFVLWLPVEKLFLTQIGFTPALIGVLAAVYAGVVPLVELPSGLLADRWGRRGALALSSASMAAASLVGGLSHGVGLYLVSAVLLGVSLALASGTVDAMIYDVLVEVTGTGDDFSRRIGFVRVLEGVGLAGSALAGAALAAVTSPRTAYVVSVVPLVVAIVAAMRFREARVQRPDETVSLREQLATVWRTMSDRAAVVPALLLGALTGVALQIVFEFGPVWLVQLHAPTGFYGVHWALLTAMLAVGGRVASRVPWRGPVPVMVTALVTAAAAVTALSRDLVIVVPAQLLVALLLVVVGVHASQQLHDAIPSVVRSSVVSAASTLTWLAFVPIGLLTGAAADAAGIRAAGWVLVALGVLTGVVAHRGVTAGARR